MSFGGAVKLTGESEYRKSLKKITQNLKQVSAEMKLATAGFNKNDKSIVALTAKSNGLNNKLEVQAEKVKILKAQFVNFQAQCEQNAKENEKLEKTYNAEKTKLDELGKTLGVNSDEYKKQKEVVEKTANELRKSTKNQEANETSLNKLRTQLTLAEADYAKTKKAIEDNDKALKNSEKENKEASSAYNKLNSTIKSQEKELEDLKQDYINASLEEGKNSDKAQDLSKKYNALSNELARNKKNLNGVEKALDDVDKEAEKAGDGFTVFKGVVANLTSEVLTGAIQKLKEFAAATIQAGASFEAAMSEVEAISGATGGELTALTDKAKEMGAKTKYSATESAAAFKYMSMAGWKTSDMLKGIDGVMNLAAASGEDLATTSDIVTDALTALGYQAGDATKLADVMAAASSNANTNVHLMGETFKYAASVAGSLGYSMEDVAVQTGLMANAGIKGTQAGTSLRSIITRLATDAGASSKSLGALGILTKQLGVEFYNADGSVRNLGNMLNETRVKWKKLTKEEKANYANKIAGKNAITGWLSIMNASEKDVTKLTNAVKNSTGASAKMAKTMNDNVVGSLTILKSQIEGVQIQIFEKLSPAFQKGLKEAQKFIKGVNWDKVSDSIKGFINALMGSVQWLIENIGTVTGALKLMIAAFAIKKLWDATMVISNMAKSFVGLIANIIATTTAEGGLTAAQEALNVAMDANPIGVVVLALTALAGVIWAVVSAANAESESHKKAMEQLEQQGAEINKNVESYKELEKQKQSAIDKGMTEMSHYKSLWNELQSIVDQNGKVKKGYEERASFISTTLSKALGVEVKDVKGVIQNYNNLKKSIDDVMEKKKAQIILDAEKSEYEEAIKNQQSAVLKLDKIESDLATKRSERDSLEVQLANAKRARDNTTDERTKYHWQSEVNRISALIREKNKQVATEQKQYNTQQDLVKKYAYNISNYERNMELAHKGEYKKMSTATWEYVKNFQGAGEAERKSLEKQNKTTKKYLALLKEMKKKSGKNIYDSQIAAAELQIKQNEKDLKRYTATTKSGLNNNKNTWNKKLAESLSVITGKKVEFRKVGKENVELYVDGERQGRKISKKEMQKLVNESANIVKNKNNKGKYKSAGEFILDGFKKGITNKDKQQSIFSTVAKLGGKVLNALMRSLKEKSPSKATEEMGVFLLQGLTNGIVEEELSVFNEVAKFSKKLLKTFATNVNYQEVGASLANSFDKGVSNTLKKTKNTFSKSVKNYVNTQIKNIPKYVYSTTAKKWAKNTDGAKLKKAYNSFGKTVINEFNSAVSTATKQVSNNLKSKVTKLSTEMQTKITEVNTKIANMRSKLSGYGELYTTDEKGNIRLSNIQKQTNVLKKYASNLKRLKGKVSGALMSEIAEMGVDDAVKYTNELLRVSNSELAEYSKSFVKKQKLADEISKTYYSDQLKEIKTKYTDKIKEAFRKAGLEINDIGKNATKGFLKGMKSVKTDKDVKKIAKNIVKQMKKALGVDSPSKVFADEIGKNAALGIGQGFVTEMPRVTSEMQAAIPTRFNSTSEPRQNYDYGANLIGAFKTALSQMKIELDDEVAGKFVEDTVTRAVYT